jgi:hypothetical protein
VLKKINKKTPERLHDSYYVTRRTPSPPCRLHRDHWPNNSSGGRLRMWKPTKFMVNELVINHSSRHGVRCDERTHRLWPRLLGDNMQWYSDPFNTCPKQGHDETRPTTVHLCCGFVFGGRAWRVPVRRRSLFDTPAWPTTDNIRMHHQLWLWLAGALP